MDEIAYNTINTDASAQIDILTKELTVKNELKIDKNRVESAVRTTEATITKVDEANTTVLLGSDNANLIVLEYIYK